MIDLYTWTTPNGRKVSIMLEELELPYRVIAIDLGKGAQHTPGFQAVTPNEKIPAIVDHDVPGGPLTLFESGAILFHLAERSGRLFGEDARQRATTMQWLMYQMSHVGPPPRPTRPFLTPPPPQLPPPHPPSPPH